MRKSKFTEEQIIGFLKSAPCSLRRPGWAHMGNAAWLLPHRLPINQASGHTSTKPLALTRRDA